VKTLGKEQLVKWKKNYFIGFVAMKESSSQVIESPKLSFDSQNYQHCIYLINNQAEKTYEDCLLLGGCYFHLKEYQKALELYLFLKKTYSYSKDILMNLSVVHMCMQQLDQAKLYCEEILKKNQNDEQASLLMAEIFEKKEDYSLCESYLKKAYEVSKSTSCLLRIVQVFEKQDKGIQAIKCIKEAYNQGIKNSTILNRLAWFFLKKNEFIEAKKYFLEALLLDPKNVNALVNLGNLYLETMQVVLAKEVLTNLSKLPLDPETLLSKGRLERELGFIDAAEASLNVVVKSGDQRQKNMALWNISHMQLIKRDFENGWKNYENRLLEDISGVGNLNSSKMWKGEPLKNKAILIFSEQGYGDSIQFLRFLPWLKDQAKQVYLVVSKSLETLVKSNPFFKGINLVFSKESFQYNCWSFLPSLAKYYGVNANNVPVTKGYLFPDKNRVDYFSSFIDSDLNKLKVGLVWKGNSNRYLDSYRSLSLFDFSPLLSVKGVSFYSFQKGDGETDLLNDSYSMKIHNLSSCIEDFSDSAALLSHMDLLITIDSAMAHLGGAIGKETWVLNRFASDWRYGIQQEDCMWYDSFKLYNQKSIDSWKNVIDQLVVDLGKKSEERLSRISYSG
jgi:tetratricopeptide (TPR) repeat protein